MDIVICRHEAAHSVCAWFLGIIVYRIQVTGERNRRAGKWPKDRFGKELRRAAGHTEYERVETWRAELLGQNGAPTLKQYCARRLVATLGGPIQTALDMGQSLNSAFLASGLDDRSRAYHLRSCGNISQPDVHKIIRHTALFLASPAASKAVMEISRRLIMCGRVKRPQIEAICAAAFRSPVHTHPCSLAGMKKPLDLNGILALEISKHSSSYLPQRPLAPMRRRRTSARLFLKPEEIGV